MSYSYITFLRELSVSDKSIKIFGTDDILQYSINPFSIVNVRVSNNSLKINLENDKVILLDFSSINESKLALVIIQEQINTLIHKVPLRIDNDINNYLNSVSGSSGTSGLSVSGSSGTSGLSVSGSSGTSGLSVSGSSGTSGLSVSGSSGTSGLSGIPYIGTTQSVDLGEYQLKLGQLEFDQTPSGIFSVGKVRWNDFDGTIELMLKGGNVTLQVGQEQLTRVVNKTGVNLLESEYKVVYIVGAQGNRLKCGLGLANNDLFSNSTLGIVTENILNNGEGFITTSGLVREIDTTGDIQGETWLEGDILYLSSVIPGGLTNIKPIAPNHLTMVGYVVNSSSTQGSIYVKVQIGFGISDLHDVLETGKLNNDVLTYDVLTGLWKNRSIYNAYTMTSGTTYSFASQSTNTLSINKAVGSTTSVILSTSPVNNQFFIVKDRKGDSLTNPIIVSAGTYSIDGNLNATMSQTGKPSLTFLFVGNEYIII